jgi:hypothetical protein
VNAQAQAQGCDKRAYMRKPWPLLPPEDVVLAVNNAINMLLSYPHRRHAIWADWISIDQNELNELFNRLRGRRNESPFDRMM